MGILSTLEGAISGAGATGTAPAAVAGDVESILLGILSDLMAGKTLVQVVADALATAAADAVAAYQRQLAASISSVPVPSRPAKAAATPAPAPAPAPSKGAA